MKIGELVCFMGFVVLCICFYEDVGLLVVQCQVNGYCDYLEQVVLLLELIMGVQCVGFSLEEICVLLLLDMGQWQYEVLIMMLQQKVVDIEVLQLWLVESWVYLLVLIEDIQVWLDGIDCVVNLWWVLDCVKCGELVRLILVVGDIVLL